MAERTEAGRAPSIGEEELDSWKEGLEEWPGAWAWESERSEVRPDPKGRGQYAPP